METESTSVVKSIETLSEDKVGVGSELDLEEIHRTCCLLFATNFAHCVTCAAPVRNKQHPVLVCKSVGFTTQLTQNYRGILSTSYLHLSAFSAPLFRSYPSIFI